MQEEKKRYLGKYLLQETKINTLNQLAIKNPQRKDYYLRKIKESKELRAEIEEKIEAVEDGTLSEILYQKYIFGKTLEQISYILNYSKRHIERLHIKALEKIEL